MATIGPVALTLADWAKRIDDDGKIAEIINLLSQTNEILDDMLWVEGNLPTGHKTTIRTGLPAAYWRLLNMGVPRGKSTTAQITESCGMLETYSDIDVDLVALSGNDRAFRLSEELAFLEGMNQQMAGTIFYNNITGVAGPTGSPTGGPAAFMGLAPRYPSVSTATSQTANNVIDAGGTGQHQYLDLADPLGADVRSRHFPQGPESRFPAGGHGQNPGLRFELQSLLRLANSLQMGRGPRGERLAVCGPDLQHRCQRLFRAELLRT